MKILSPADAIDEIRNAQDCAHGISLLKPCDLCAEAMKIAEVQGYRIQKDTP